MTLVKKIGTKKGTVYLVGAGPGDPGLITQKGASLLADADVVVYDRLVSPELLELNASAKKIYAGKKTGAGQQRINRLLVEFARKGKNVVRLKGGDPFIFGRGGEEAFHLARHRISYEIVPGITAGYGAAAYAGIPVTDRRYASEVVFVTGHEEMKSDSAVDWKLLAQSRGTVVLFMGIKNLPQVVQKLIREGKPAHTKISVIEWGTLSRQRVVEGTLATIAGKVKKSEVASPALTVLGEVNRLRKQLAWFEKKPLFGKKIMVTRARPQAGELKQRLKALGAQVFECPVIHIAPPKDFKPLDRALRTLEQFDWVLFTSVNGADAVFGRLRALKRDARYFSRIRVAAIGDATRGILEKNGIHPDLVPAEFTSAALVKALQKKGQIRGRHFLLPRTDIAPPWLKQELEKRGARVTQVVAYRTLFPKSGKNALNRILRGEKIDFVCFTSASTVENFFRFADKKTVRQSKARLISIGPVTSAALRARGFHPFREARPHHLEGLVQCLIQSSGKRKK